MRSTDIPIKKKCLSRRLFKNLHPQEVPSEYPRVDKNEKYKRESDPSSWCDYLN